MNESYIDQAGTYLLASNHTTVFTGAGISVESGIPSFRGENGLWSVYNPELLDIHYFTLHPEKSWNLIKQLFYDHFSEAKPNPAHTAVAMLESMGYVKTVITQNIDHLHQDAGSRNVIEYHGTLRRLTCMTCKRVVEYEFQIFNSLPPRCAECSGILKPNITFFSEPIAEPANRNAFIEADFADLFLIIGTTGEIQPASLIPLLAKKNGAKIIEVNITKSNYTDQIVDIYLQGKASEILQRLLEYVKRNQKAQIMSGESIVEKV